MSSELSIRSAKKLKGGRKFEKFLSGEGCKSVLGIFSCSGTTFRPTMLGGRCEFLYLYSSGFGDRIDLSMKVTQSAKSHEDFNSKIIGVRKQGKK